MIHLKILFDIRIYKKLRKGRSAPSNIYWATQWRNYDLMLPPNQAISRFPFLLTLNIIISKYRKFWRSSIFNLKMSKIIIKERSHISQNNSNIITRLEIVFDVFGTFRTASQANTEQDIFRIILEYFVLSGKHFIMNLFRYML